MLDERACVVVTAEDGPQAGRVVTVGEMGVTVQGRRLSPAVVLWIDCAPPYRQLLRRRGYQVLVGREARWPDVLADLEAWEGGATF
jgi:hypothetical protein